MDEKCSHTFANESRCPNGTFMSSGLSICGNKRQICLLCPEQETAIEECNTKCSFVKKTKNIITGCLSYECVRKRCPEIKIPPCRSASGLEIKRDSCDCARVVCAKPKGIQRNALIHLSIYSLIHLCIIQQGHL